ncbi:MAG: glycosyltransferase family 4 protein [Chloroflexota bacterium]|nr:MAG: glycosyltransferase family 4 protein [Chloroflexota bacterium]
MTSLRILMPVFNRIGKGTYWRTYGLAQELATRGHQITLLGAGPVGRAGVEVKRSGGFTQVAFPSLLATTQGSGYDPGDILARIRWLWSNAERYDLVHAFENRPSCLIPVWMSKRRGACFVSDWCDWFGQGGSVEHRPNHIVRALLRPVETALENRSRPRARGVTVINQTLYQKARDLGVEDKRILVLPNGAYIDDFQPSGQAEARRRLGLPPDIPLMAYTGTLLGSDADLMAAAFERIKAEMPEAQLLLIGYTNLDLRSMVRHPEAVISTGQVSFQALVDYVSASTIGWVPLADNAANAGRFPMKINDFMASGKAAIVTDVGDLGEVVREHGVGLVARPDPKSVAEQAIRLLKDEALRQQFEIRARQVAESVFNWPRIVDPLEDFYFQLMANGQ